jgi:hypothetical protein
MRAPDLDAVFKQFLYSKLVTLMSIPNHDKISFRFWVVKRFPGYLSISSNGIPGIAVGRGLEEAPT